MTIPLTVIGGFLGAGKTTLLNQILASKTRRRFAVLVNDFGDLAIDGDLVTAHDGDTITFANGCVCCTMGDDFVATIMALLQRPELPEHILIEASGVGDPRAIAEVAILHPKLCRDMVVVLVDAETVQERVGDPRLSDTLEKQLQAADLLILNKCDRIDDEQREAVRDWLQVRSPTVPVLPAQHAQFPLDLLFAGFDKEQGISEKAAPDSGHHHRSVFTSVTLPFDKPVDLDALRDGLSAMPASVLRAKGFVASKGEPGGVYLVQLAGRHIDISKAEERRPGDYHTKNLVFIGMTDMPGRDFFEETLMANA